MKSPFKIIQPSKHKASDYFLKIVDAKGDDAYIVLVDLWYFSKRYNKWIVCEKGDVSDGATGAFDIDSFSWLFHDEVCNTGKFNDATKLTNWQASSIVHDILLEEGRCIRAKTWRYATFLAGGGEARDNGMLSIKHK